METGKREYDLPKTIFYRKKKEYWIEREEDSENLGKAYMGQNETFWWTKSWDECIERYDANS